MFYIIILTDSIDRSLLCLLYFPFCILSWELANLMQVTLWLFCIAVIHSVLYFIFFSYLYEPISVSLYLHNVDFFLIRFYLSMLCKLLLVKYIWAVRSSKLSMYPESTSFSTVLHCPSIVHFHCIHLDCRLHHFSNWTQCHKSKLALTSTCFCTWKDF